MQKIGILGGTFNPVHIGHLVAAEVAYERLNLNKVVFSPSCIPPHKTRQNLVTAEDRLKMVQLAVTGNDHFAVTDYEVKKKGKSYSIDLARYLKSQYPDSTKFYFIVGEDSHRTLSSWKMIDELLSLVTFAVVNRGGFKRKNSRIPVREVAMPGLHISSSIVRRSLAKGRSVRYVLPDSVIKYIKGRKIYE